MYQAYQLLKQFFPYYIILTIAVEYILLSSLFKPVNHKEYRINITAGLIVVITQSIFQLLLLQKLNPWLYEHRIFKLPNRYVAIIFCFIAYTFLQYFTHVLSHKIRIFWCLHEVHHSSQDINISSGLRNSIFDIISTDIFYLLIPLCGVHPMIYLIVYTMAKIWGTFIHINDNLISEIPVLNNFIVDPKTHHLHHAKNKVYLDKNFGETILIYDKLFNTYVIETEKPVYGSTNNPSPDGFWKVQLNEFKLLLRDIRNSKNMIEAFRYIFYPPGWKPKHNAVIY